MESPSTNRSDEANAELHDTECLASIDENLVPGKTLILSIRRELFVHNTHGSGSSIPKRSITFDEKYATRCLELIRSVAAARNFTPKVDILLDHTNSLAYIEDRFSSTMTIEYPLGGGAGAEVIGSLSGSQSMINILKSPLLQQFGSLHHNADLLGVSEPFYSDSVKAASTISPSLEKQVKVVDHRREASISSTSSSSDQSSSCGYGTSFQAMLKCTWKDGLLHHVFTVDDKREVYVANLSKAESCRDKGVDYLYTFHSQRNDKKECDMELQSIAKMRVSTSISFSSDNSQVWETQYVLSMSSDSRTGELQTQKKNKRLTKKVSDVFRPCKQRPYSKFGGSGTISEDAPLDSSEDIRDNSLDVGAEDNKYVPNLEMAAIVVKEIYHNHKEAEVGGWGLKFLKKSGGTASPDTMIPAKHSRNTGECSTSTEILIPAGLHGGPRNRVGGPSSLIERWKSDGHCDCGGWDIGCPLTILNNRSGSTGHSSHIDNSGECKSLDLFMQGSKQSAPMIKMVNIHNGLYYIHFQSPLSSLQCFAIAAAMIHSRSPILRAKVCRS